MKNLVRLFAVLASLMIVPPAFAVTSWRCGSRLVGTGQSISDVYAVCGEPTDRTGDTEFVTVRVSRDVTVTRPVWVERWTYDRGSQRLVRYLTFRDGRLVDIDEAGYGY